MKTWFWNILVSLDQGVNTLFGGNPDETISSRAAKAQRENRFWGCFLCEFLNIFEEDHCEKSIELDEK